MDPDTIVLRSAGIDIGSATSHLVVSAITLKRLGRAHSSRYVTVKRLVDYESPVIFTPYSHEDAIDAEQLITLIGEWLREARNGRREIDTGVVLLTGEAVRKKNAHAIAERITEVAGDFVCAAAGDLFEAQMAAWGSGTVSLSVDEGTMMNVDVGGGTTKVAVAVNGEVVARCVFRVGARAVVVDEQGQVCRLEPSGAIACKALGLPAHLGARLPADARERIATWMIDRLDEYLFNEPMPEAARALVITPALQLPAEIDGVVFSSGVAEHIYEREQRDFGDLGRQLAAAIHAKAQGSKWPWKWFTNSAPIRATVLGISQQTVEVSGDTVYIGKDVRLPVKNRRIVNVDLRDVDPSAIVPEMEAASGESHMTSLDGGLAWNVRCEGRREFSYMRQLAHGLGIGARQLDTGPSVIILSEDVALTIGRLIGSELGIKADVVVVDGLASTGDFIDIGRYQVNSGTLPVVLKSFLFDEPQAVVAVDGRG